MKKLLAMLLSLLFVLSVLPAAVAEEEVDTRPRTVVTTDLECDDIDSLLHLLLYANDIDIAGIVVSASTHHWTGDGEHTLEEIVENPPTNRTRERMGLGNDITEWRPMELNWVYDTLRNEYSEVYPNLIKHDPDYPSPGELIERTKIGNVLFEGDMREPTEGSNYIMEILLDDDMRDLYLQAWGGTNTIGRALLSIEEEYAGTDQWEEIYAKVCEKAVIISFGDQDNVYPEYIAENWPTSAVSTASLAASAIALPRTPPCLSRVLQARMAHREHQVRPWRADEQVPALWRRHLLRGRNPR